MADILKGLIDLIDPVFKTVFKTHGIVLIDAPGMSLAQGPYLSLPPWLSTNDVGHGTRFPTEQTFIQNKLRHLSSLSTASHSTDYQNLNMYIRD